MWPLERWFDPSRSPYAIVGRFFGGGLFYWRQMTEYERFVEKHYLEPKRFAPLDAEDAKYNTQEVLLWIEHSSERCYKAQLRIEAYLEPVSSAETVSLNRAAKRFKALAAAAVSEYRTTLKLSPGEFRVSLDDVATSLAKDYLAGHRRAG